MNEYIFSDGKTDLGYIAIGFGEAKRKLIGSVRFPCNFKLKEIKWDVS